MADPAADVLVHSEPDERFWLSVSRTRDDCFLLIHAGSSVTDEVPNLPPRASDAGPTDEDGVTVDGRVGDTDDTKDGPTDKEGRA